MFLRSKIPPESNSTGLTSQVCAERHPGPFIRVVRASQSVRAVYLPVSEIFPLEIRALAIAIFYAFGTLAGGVGAPILFGWIIGTGSKTALLIGYLVGAALMIIGAVVEAFIGVDAERKSLEHVATPLSCRDL
jgi:hypothetical protein